MAATQINLRHWIRSRVRADHHLHRRSLAARVDEPRNRDYLSSNDWVVIEKWSRTSPAPKGRNVKARHGNAGTSMANDTSPD
jgi:hypothetical protein